LANDANSILRICK